MIAARADVLDVVRTECVGIAHSGDFSDLFGHSGMSKKWRPIL